MISNPRLLAEAMREPSLSVPSYDISRVTNRLKINLQHINALRAYFPLAVEGEAHRQLRARFAHEIAANTNQALEAFEKSFQENLNRLLADESGADFCLIKDLLQPTLKIANLTIAGIDDSSIEQIENIPQLFDDTISLRMRLAIDATIEKIISKLPENMSVDEKYFRTAIIALNANTLLGSTSQSVINAVSEQESTPLNKIRWSAELPATGLPLIEKKATKDVTIGGCAIKAGDRIRLFLDAAGFQGNTTPQYSDLYFAAGPHRCPGMAFSRQIWKLIVKYLSQVDKRLVITATTYRERDYVFNLYEQARAKFHG
jgi:cytochrome P450